ncbi:protein of unknown function [Thermomonospora echinospora]|uniref:DUF397 domain-containing protein n=1 Tax=Thermomonospora echinospora TaxID=1992 RepID=A0A1H6CCR1_9ACTN|nr:DUF397 domain-containing protein [Thermomonospora echinospora]SEG70425.1 protein of unknown function [Thermomonospora echinospora]
MDLSTAKWRKSSYSGDNGGHCVELAWVAATPLSWRKSSRSTDNGGNCVELADLPGVVAVRDSKDPDGPALAFTRRQWSVLLRKLKDA